MYDKYIIKKQRRDSISRSSRRALVGAIKFESCGNDLNPCFRTKERKYI